MARRADAGAVVRDVEGDAVTGAGGKLRAAEDAEYLERQELTVRCMFCAWYIRGPALLVLSEQRKHFQGHARKRLPRKHTRNLRNFTQNALDPTEQALVDLERRRRANETGIRL